MKNTCGTANVPYKMATPVFTTRHGAQGHPAASTRWLQGPGPGVRSREVGCSVALAADGDSLELVSPTRAPPPLARRPRRARLAPATCARRGRLALAPLPRAPPLPPRSLPSRVLYLVVKFSSVALSIKLSRRVGTLTISSHSQICVSAIQRLSTDTSSAIADTSTCSAIADTSTCSANAGVTVAHWLQ